MFHSKKIQILTVLQLVFSVLNAQKLDLKLSPEFNLPRGTDLQNYITKKDGLHYMLASGPSIMQFDNKFNIKKHETYELPSKSYAIGTTEFGDGFSMIVCSNGEERKSRDISCVPIDYSLKAGKPKALFTLNYEERNDEPSFVIARSKDKKKILISGFSKDLDMDEKENAFFIVFDETFNEIWRKKIEFNYTKRQMAISTYLAAENGFVYLLAKITESELSRGNSKLNTTGERVANYGYSLFRINPQGEMKEFKMNTKEKFINGIKMELALDGSSIDIAGLYASKFIGLNQGYLCYNFDCEKENFTLEKMKDFTDRELSAVPANDLGNERAKGVRDKGLTKNVVFNNFFPQDDGGMIATAEDYYITTSSTYSYGSRTSKSTDFHWDNIYIMKFSIDGALDWISCIPKQQTNMGLFASYAAFGSESGVNIIYNDDKDIINPQQKQLRLFTTLKDAVGCSVFINGSDGSMNRQILVKGKTEDTVLVPSDCFVISEKEIFISGRKPKLFNYREARFGIITYK